MPFADKLQDAHCTAAHVSRLCDLRLLFDVSRVVVSGGAPELHLNAGPLSFDREGMPHGWMCFELAYCSFHLGTVVCCRKDELVHVEHG